jgi:ribosomal protein L11 methyltransferase
MPKTKACSIGSKIFLGSTRTWPALDADIGDLAERIELFQAALADYDVTAINEDGGSWRVFFRASGERDRAIETLHASYGDIDIRAVDVPDEDWAARSQAALRSVRIGGIVVSPPWDVPERADGTVIVIQPSMGFGTAHHGTTRLCLSALQRIDLDGRSVTDVGTGSGVLAIAASLLGAAPVIGFDDDADAVAAARENLALNRGANVRIDVGDVRTRDRALSDVVVANLTGGLLVNAASELQQLTKPGGRLILSGFMVSEEAEVLRAFAPLGVEQREEEEEWVCVTLR